MEPNTKTAAETQRRLLECGLATLAQIKAWADAGIAALDAPPPDWLIETSLARSQGDALTALGSAEGRADEAVVLREFARVCLDALDRDPERDSEVAKGLYRLALEQQSRGVTIPREMPRLWDSIDLARQGTYGVLAAEREKLRSFLVRTAERPTHTRIVVTSYGGPASLQTVEEELPEPKRGEVRVRVQAAGVSLPDVMMREGIHPETPRVPFTPGWDLVGVVDRLGEGVSGIAPGQLVAALPIHGAYAEFVCLPRHKLVSVPAGLDPAEAVSLVLNYVTAYQMLHRSAKVSVGQRVLIHGAAGGVGSALLQLGRLAGLVMYGTCSARNASAVAELGGIPIDYERLDFVKEVRERTGGGVDVVFDGIGGTHIWRSRDALRAGGVVVAYGLTGSLRGGRVASGRGGRRHRFRALAIFGVFIAGAWLLPGRRRVVPYSIQTLERLRPAFFHEDLAALFELLRQKKIAPLVAQRLPLTEARRAHELLGQGGVTGKLVLVTRP